MQLRTMAKPVEADCAEQKVIFWRKKAVRSRRFHRGRDLRSCTMIIRLSPGELAVAPPWHRRSLQPLASLPLHYVRDQSSAALLNLY